MLGVARHPVMRRHPVTAVSKNATIPLVMEEREPLDQGIHWRITHSAVNDPGVCWSYGHSGRQENDPSNLLLSSSVDPHFCSQQPIDEATHLVGLPDDLIRDLDLARFDQLNNCLHLLIYVER
jgi:hypothetical protein